MTEKRLERKVKAGRLKANVVCISGRQGSTYSHEVPSQVSDVYHVMFCRRLGLDH
jgi:hypothetical protein